MHALRVFLTAALLFALTPSPGKLGSAAGALLLVALGVGLALAVASDRDARAVGYGALGGLAWGSVGGLSTAAGGALVVGAAYLGRTLLIEGRVYKAVHLGMALLGGALGAQLAMAHQSGEWEVQVAAIALAATFTALPLLVPADDSTARRLEAAAKGLPVPLANRLLAAAGLRRSVRFLPLDRGTRRQLERLWRGLLGLAETHRQLEQTARHTVAGQEAALLRLDHHLNEHATMLEESHLAIDLVRATTLGFDDHALEAARATRDALTNEHAALLEVAADLGARAALCSAPPATRPGPGMC